MIFFSLWLAALQMFVLPLGGGMTSSMSLGLVRFHSFLMITFSSSFCWSMGPEGGRKQHTRGVRTRPRWGIWPRRTCVQVSPSVLIFSEVRTSAKRVALKVTVPSGCSGTFMATSLYEVKRMRVFSPPVRRAALNSRALTLQATRWGHSFPKPRGGWILRSMVTTSMCFIRPLWGGKHLLHFIYLTGTYSNRPQMFCSQCVRRNVNL